MGIVIVKNKLVTFGAEVIISGIAKELFTFHTESRFVGLLSGCAVFECVVLKIVIHGKRKLRICSF